MEDPPGLRSRVTSTVVHFLCIAMVGAFFGPVGLAISLVVVTLWSAWTNRRPTIEVESVREAGVRGRIQVHQLADVEAALAAVPMAPATPPRVALTQQGDVANLYRGCASRTAMPSGAIGFLGDRGSPDTLAPMASAL
jgi:hypothetical protein